MPVGWAAAVLVAQEQTITIRHCQLQAQPIQAVAAVVQELMDTLIKMVVLAVREL